MKIHNTAIVDPKAELADDVLVGPYAVIKANVRIGSGTSIESHCVINEYTAIGKDCKIFSGAIIGSVTQDKKFEGGKSFLEIGDNNIIREYVTINRGTEENSKTIIGNDNLLMAYTHIAHNCIIGNSVTIANCGTLAGHVIIEDNAIIGGLGGIHQFVKMGSFSILGGHSKLVQDLPPYFMADGHPAKVFGINSLGLERAGTPDDVKDGLKKAFKIVYSMKLNTKNALKRIKEEIPPSKEISNLISFIESSQRGISR
ncbi:MAG: acyl-ACP--UDP-N-acetylglucosamine O-acyltransferase [Candidatus Omnitrophota bacterium]